MTEEVCLDLAQEIKSPREENSPIRELLDEYPVEGFPSVREYLLDKPPTRAAGFCKEHPEILVPYAFELLDDEKNNEKRQYLYDMFYYGNMEIDTDDLILYIRKILDKGIPLEECKILSHDLLEIKKKADLDIGMAGELPRASSLFVKFYSKSVVLLASKINRNLE